MRALYVSMLVLLTAFFGLVPASGQPQDANQVQQVTKAEGQEGKETSDANAAADVNAVTDANAPADANAVLDPNAVKAAIEKFDGLRRVLNDMDKDSIEEIREWTRGRLDDRLELALAMQKQVTSELKFLRELAVKEKAAETATAIDGILLDRQKRFKGVIEELERNSERIRRLAEREERRNQERNGARERIPPRERVPRERPSRSTQQQ